MPTLLSFEGFRFFFYSNEGSEPAHVHISKGEANGKIWLEPEVATAYLHNFTNNEIKTINKLLDKHAADFKIKWYEFFKG